jgi:hypothetical protein
LFLYTLEIELIKQSVNLQIKHEYS